MDMAAEGAFEGDLRQEQRAVKERIEALIARHRTQPNGGRISCSTLATFENILLNSRSDKTPQRSGNAGSPTSGTESNSRGFRTPRESDRSSHQADIKLSETSSSPQDCNPDAPERDCVNGLAGVERDTIRFSTSDKKMAQRRMKLDKIYTEEDDQKSSLNNPYMATWRRDRATTLRDDKVREERDPGSSAGEKTIVSEPVASGSGSMHENLASTPDGANVVGLGRETSMEVEFDGGGSVDTDDAAMDMSRQSSSGEVESHVGKSELKGAIGAEHADIGTTSLTATGRSSVDDTSKEKEKEEVKSTQAEFMDEQNCSLSTEENKEETANKIVAETFQERMTPTSKTSVDGIPQVFSSQESSWTRRKRRDSGLRPLWTCQYFQQFKCSVYERFFHALEFPPSKTTSGHRHVNVWAVCTCPRTVQNMGKQSSENRPYVCRYYEIMQRLLGHLPEQLSNFTVFKRKPASTLRTRQSDLLGVCSSLSLFLPVAHQCLVNDQGDDVNDIHKDHKFMDNETKSHKMEARDMISGEEAITNKNMQSYDKTLAELTLVPDTDVLSSGTVATDDSDVVSTVENTLKSDSKDITRDTASSGAIDVPYDSVSSHDTQSSTSGRIIDDTDSSELAVMDTEPFIYLVQTNGGNVVCISNSLYVFELWRAVKRNAASRLDNNNDDKRKTEEDDSSDGNEDGPKRTFSEFSDKSDDDEESILTETRKEIKMKVVESPAGYSQDTTFDKNNDNSVDDTASAMDNTLNKKTTDSDRDLVKGNDEGWEEQNKYDGSVRINDKRESSSSEIHYLEQLIHKQSLEQTSKIQSLELMIIKLEKQMLTQTLHEQKELTRLLQLENQILHLENKLLQLNQSHALLHEENEKMKSRQSQYLALEHKAGEQNRGPGHAGLAAGGDGSTHLQLISAQQTKVARLTKLLRSQAAVVHRLQRQYDQLEGQSKALEQLVTTQAIVLSQTTLKMQELAEENLKIRKEILEMGSKLDPPLSSSRILEKIEHLLHKGFSLTNAGRSPIQPEILASQQVMKASQPGVQGARRNWSDIMIFLPSSSAESRQRKCEGNKSSRLCLYYIIIITQCPPFSAVTWGICPYLAREFFNDRPTGTPQVGRVTDDAFHRVASDTANTDTKRTSVGESRTTTGTDLPKVLLHAKLDHEGTTGGKISFGGVTAAGREENLNTDNSLIKKLDYHTAGKDKMAGETLERLDLPPTVSVQDAHSPGMGGQPDIAPKETTTRLFADQDKTYDGEVVDVVDIPKIQPQTVLKILEADAPGNPTRVSDSFEKHGKGQILPRPVRVLDGVMQDDDNADGASVDGDPRSRQASHSMRDPASSARLEVATANQESVTKETASRDSAAAGKASESKASGKQPHRGGEPAVEQMNKHVEMKAEEMEKKLRAAERRVLLYPSVDNRKPRGKQFQSALFSAVL